MNPEACVSCPQLCASRTQVVLPSVGASGLLCIGEAPGQKEDEQGEGFAGAAGKTLDGLLAAHGIGRDQYGRANICRCRPPENRKPKPAEIAACIPKLGEFIVRTRPKVLLLVGGTATAKFLGAGSLFRRIKENAETQFSDLALAHPKLREAMQPVLTAQGGVRVVAMPHTSGLAFHRRCPNGERWSAIGAQQVALAVSLLRI